MNNLVENTILKTCVDEVSLLQRRADSILVEKNASVCSITEVDDKVVSLDKFQVYDVVSIFASPIDELYYVDNSTNHEVEELVSQSHRSEEAESCLSSDENNGADLSWHEEASNESKSDLYVS